MALPGSVLCLQRGVASELAMPKSPDIIPANAAVEGRLSWLLGSGTCSTSLKPVRCEQAHTMYATSNPVQHRLANEARVGG